MCLCIVTYWNVQNGISWIAKGALISLCMIIFWIVQKDGSWIWKMLWCSCVSSIIDMCWKKVHELRKMLWSFCLRYQILRTGMWRMITMHTSIPHLWKRFFYVGFRDVAKPKEFHKRSQHQHSTSDSKASSKPTFKRRVNKRWADNITSLGAQREASTVWHSVEETKC